MATFPADLPEPRTPGGRAGLAAVLAAPRTALVATDYDGTLAPVVDDPSHAVPQPGAVEALARLAGTVGSLALVTGRPAAEAVTIGHLERVPGLVVLGAYGAQRWEHGAGTDSEAGPAELDDQVLRDLQAALDRAGSPGIQVERKGAAVAVHTRGCADPETARRELLGPLRSVADVHGLMVEPGRLVLELRPRGTDKGLALRAFAAERGARAVAFLGDDLGDLAAFGAVERLRSEGVPGLTVASGSVEAPEVSDRADLVVDGPLGVAAFLAALAAALGG